MTRNLSVWNSLRPFSVGFDSIFEEFDRVLESTERHNSNYPPYNIHKISENDYKIEVALAGYSKDDLDVVIKDGVLASAPEVGISERRWASPRKPSRTERGRVSAPMAALRGERAPLPGAEVEHVHVTAVLRSPSPSLLML